MEHLNLFQKYTYTFFILCWILKKISRLLCTGQPLEYIYNHLAQHLLLFDTVVRTNKLYHVYQARGKFKRELWLACTFPPSWIPNIFIQLWGGFLGEQSFKWRMISDRGTTSEVLAYKSYNLAARIVILRHQSNIAVIYFPKIHLFFVVGIYMNNLQLTPTQILLLTTIQKHGDINFITNNFTHCSIGII